jgi:hypothetical protein
LHTKEQSKEIETLKEGALFADKDIDKSRIVTPLHIREHTKKHSKNRKTQDEDDEPIESLTPASRKKREEDKKKT